MAVLPCHVLWLRWVSKNNLNSIIQALNFQVAAASEKTVLLPIAGRTCATDSQLAAHPVTSSFIKESCACRQSEGQQSNQVRRQRHHGVILVQLRSCLFVLLFCSGHSLAINPPSCLTTHEAAEKLHRG